MPLIAPLTATAFICSTANNNAAVPPKVDKGIHFFTGYYNYPLLIPTHTSN
jgi:hypothetical protein